MFINFGEIIMDMYEESAFSFSFLSRLLLGSTQGKWWLGWLDRGCPDIAFLEIRSTSQVVQRQLAKREK